MGDRLEEIRAIYQGIAEVPGATLTRGQADVLWLLREVDRARSEPPPGKATWVWDDSPEEDFGQLYMPVCRICGAGPLTGEQIGTGECGERHED